MMNGPAISLAFTTKEIKMEHVQAQVRVQAPIKKKSVRQIVNVKSVLPTAGALSMSSFTVDAAMQTMEVLRGEAGNYNVQ
jgi:hypothetical protein